MTALCESLEAHFVETLSFSGGEPVLYLDKIVRLARSATKINPNVTIRLTTNARFASSLDACNKVLVQIPNLSSIRISYDDLHNSENWLASVATIVKWAARADIRCSINVSVVNPLDLVVLRGLPALGVSISVAKVAPFGRANHIATKLEWQEDVRSIPEQMDAKCKSLAKAVYFPGRGWTFCCSEVAFNHANLDSLFFSSSLEGIGSVPALKKMQELTFSELLELTPHVEGKLVHECQICSAHWEGIVYGRK
jgi:MoaA/NifB/PqqE/SkfB family radical SAM enzyme